MISYTITCPPTVGVTIASGSTQFESVIAEDLGFAKATFFSAENASFGRTVHSNGNTVLENKNNGLTWTSYSFADEPEATYLPEEKYFENVVDDEYAETAYWYGQEANAEGQLTPFASTSIGMTDVTIPKQIVSFYSATTSSFGVTGGTYSTLIDGQVTILPTTKTTSASGIAQATRTQSEVGFIPVTTVNEYTVYTAEGITRQPYPATATVWIPENNECLWTYKEETFRPYEVNRADQVYEKVGTRVTMYPKSIFRQGNILTRINLDPFADASNAVTEIESYQLMETFAENATKTVAKDIRQAEGIVKIPATEHETFATTTWNKGVYVYQRTLTTFQTPVANVETTFYGTDFGAVNIDGQIFDSTYWTTRQTITSSAWAVFDQGTIQGGGSSSGVVYWESGYPMAGELFSTGARKVLQLEKNIFRGAAAPANSGSPGQFLKAGSITAAVPASLHDAKAFQTAWLPPLFTSWTSQNGQTSQTASADAVGLSITESYPATVGSETLTEARESSAAWETEGGAVTILNMPTANVIAPGGRAAFGNNVTVVVDPGRYNTTVGQSSGQSIQNGVRVAEVGAAAQKTAYSTVPMVVGGNQYALTAVRNLTQIVA